MSCSTCNGSPECERDCCAGGRNDGTVNGCTPCGTCPPASADCESLPSQIQNFSNAFFGQVIKTVVNGEVAWTLPCNLNVGLPGNPRGDNEGLACYFLRLFANGIVGLTGPKGDTGAQGADGNHAYTVTTTAFNKPTIGTPNVQFNIIPSPVVSVGQTIYIPGQGWFLVNNIFQGQTVFASLVEAISTPTAVSTPGNLVLPTGPRGLSITGATGPQGAKGDKGDQGAKGDTGATGAAGPTGAAGTAATNINSEVVGGGTDYTMTAVYSKVDFGVSDIEVTLPTVGTYLIMVNISGINNSGATREWDFKLFNATTSADVPNSEVPRSVVVSTLPTQITLFSIVTTASITNLIQVYAATNNAAVTQTLLFTWSKIAFVKLA